MFFCIVIVSYLPGKVERDGRGGKKLSEHPCNSDDKGGPEIPYTASDTGIKHINFNFRIGFVLVSLFITFRQVKIVKN